MDPHAESVWAARPVCPGCPLNGGMIGQCAWRMTHQGAVLSRVHYAPQRIVVDEAPDWTGIVFEVPEQNGAFAWVASVHHSNGARLEGCIVRRTREEAEREIRAIFARSIRGTWK